MDELIVILPDVRVDQVLAPEYKSNASHSMLSYTAAAEMRMGAASQPGICTGMRLVLEAIA